MEENIDEFFSIIVKEEHVEVGTKWKEKCNIQTLNSVENDEERKKREVKISKPELEPLPHGLKYVYLEENEEKKTYGHFCYINRRTRDPTFESAYKE